MLVLSRLVNEKIIITVPGGQQIEIVLCSIRPHGARLGINAPREFTVHRVEVQKKIDTAAVTNQ